jgi:hypothetical protein
VPTSGKTGWFYVVMLLPCETINPIDDHMIQLSLIFAAIVEEFAELCPIPCFC